MYFITLLNTKRSILQQLAVYQGMILGLALLIDSVQGSISFYSYGFTIAILGMLLLVFAGLSVIGGTGQTQNVLLEHASSVGHDGIDEKIEQSKRDMHATYGFFRVAVTVGVLSIGIGVLMFFF